MPAKTFTKPRKKTPKFEEFNLRYKGVTKTITIDVTDKNISEARSEAVAQLKAEVDAKEQQQAKESEPEVIEDDDTAAAAVEPEPVTLQEPVTSTSELDTLRAEVAELREAFDAFKTQLELPELQDLLKLSSSLGQQFTSAWSMSEKISNLSERLDNEMFKFEALSGELEKARSEAIEKHKQSVDVIRNNTQLVNELQRESASAINAAREDAYNAQISNQVLSEQLLQQVVLGKTTPDPDFVAPQNPYSPAQQAPQQPVNNDQMPVAVDPSEMPTTPPPPAYSPGMNPAVEDPELAAKVFAASQQQQGDNNDAG